MQFLYESEQIPGKEILRGSYIEKSQQVQEIPLTKYSWNTGEYMTEISYFLALFLLFPDTSVFFQQVSAADTRHIDIQAYSS